MSSAKQNRQIAKLIVGAMAIDGSLSKEEQKKVAVTLDKLGMAELIADVGAAIEEDQGDFNMFQECKDLMTSLGADAADTAPVVFRMIADVVASDRYVSAQEASYLSALGKRLDLSPEMARKILRQVMADRRGRLEVSAASIDESIHPHLKALLSFPGAEELVGELSEDSLEEMMVQAQEAMAEGCDVTLDDVERSLTVLGLHRGATLEEAQQVWRETIDGLNLPKMANLGETFVTAALNRITRINDAYKTIVHFQEHLDRTKKAKQEADRLKRQVQSAKEPSTRNNLATQLEKDMTGVGVVKPDEEKD